MGGPGPPEATHLLKDGPESHREGGGFHQHSNQPEASEKRIVWGRLLLEGKTGEIRKGERQQGRPAGQPIQHSHHSLHGSRKQPISSGLPQQQQLHMDASKGQRVLSR